MDYLHLTEDADGVSRFTDGTIALELRDFAPPAQALFLSAPWPAERLLFLTLPAGWVGEQHPSPRRQVAFCLAGSMQVEAGDGERREIGPGDIWLMEDTAGAGHVSRVTSAAECRLAIVQFG
ncbi:cupin domain-containing protein [Limibaculum sp. FT325]|uniref:cupin domain-containing protein n=1 Tax=Thermohalobaculum sediminis TaxID=2939436 RepID=UPI0020BF7A58|nr:cupin domain-containing protein [Limibaculum sediminis]MCL5777775.1 cupin domain-containing protein [Limibaculum sediminis]